MTDTWHRYITIVRTLLVLAVVFDAGAGTSYGWSSTTRTDARSGGPTVARASVAAPSTAVAGTEAEFHPGSDGVPVLLSVISRQHKRPSAGALRHPIQPHHRPRRRLSLHSLHEPIAAAKSSLPRAGAAAVALITSTATPTATVTATDTTSSTATTTSTATASSTPTAPVTNTATATSTATAVPPATATSTPCGSACGGTPPPNLFNVACASTSACYAVGAGGTIGATGDGGLTWTAQGSGTAQDLYGIACPATSLCYAVGGTITTTGWSGAIVATGNGGATWSSQPNAPGNPLLLGIACPGPTTCYAAGFPDTILATANGGATWTNQASPLAGTGHFLNGIACPSATTCVAVGTSGAILATTSGGAIWASQPSGTANSLYGVSCPTVSICYIVGSTGTILATTTGGMTWSAQSSPTTSTLNGIACPSVTTCFAVGDNGTILTTTDGGTTWSSHPSGTTNYLGGVACPRLTMCVAVGAHEMTLVILGGSGGPAPTATPAATSTPVLPQPPVSPPPPVFIPPPVSPPPPVFVPPPVSPPPATTTPTLPATNTGAPTATSITAPPEVPVAAATVPPRPTKTPPARVSSPSTSTPVVQQEPASTPTPTAGPPVTAETATATTALSVTVLKVDAIQPAPKHHGDIPSAHRGSTITWAIHFAGGAGGQGEITAEFNSDLQDVTDSSPRGALAGRSFGWQSLAGGPGGARTVQIVTRIRGQAGCGTTVRLAASTPGGPRAEAAVRVSCPSGFRTSTRSGTIITGRPLASVHLGPNVAGTVRGVAHVRDGAGRSVAQTIVLLVPSGALTETSILTIAPVAGPLRVRLMPAAPGLAALPAGLSFQVTATGVHGAPARSVLQPMTLCLGSTGLVPAGLHPQDLRVSSYDPITDDFVALPSTTHVAQGTICAQLQHLTVVQLVAQVPAGQARAAAASAASGDAALSIMGTGRADAVTRQVAQGVSREVQHVILAQRAGATVALALPRTVLIGHPLVVGVSSGAGGEEVVYEVRYGAGPVQRARGLTGAHGYHLVRFIVPALRPAGGQNGQRLVVTVQITLTHLDGHVEQHTVHVTVLLPHAAPATRSHHG